MGHLAIEKLLKALVVRRTKEHSPYTHSLPVLAGKSTLEIPEEIKGKLVDFMEFYREARYPEEQKNFYLKCTNNFTRENLNEMKKVFAWLKETLQKS